MHIHESNQPMYNTYGPMKFSKKMAALLYKILIFKKGYAHGEQITLKKIDFTDKKNTDNE